MIPWDDTLATGDAAIDEEHRGLLLGLAALEAAMDEGAAPNALLDTIEAHVVEHFAHEEEAMRARAYQRYVQHKAEHDRFVGELLDWKAGLLAAGPTPAVREAFQRRVVGWMAGHITGSDRKLGQFLGG